ncbi:MAG: hypothetical protein A2087_11085 [Spirochaetes bacterium GWD1_61_31]|nr:MAG: hypothetical protein A2Y37_09965 [Spirochaetes bacterium GWB1_60_80]OHD43122.1 MAG: hypothetical protein A2087_11085 [Spirochaetes bacterium GWD1_61_31]OHD44256.1 MAG: hypothetical protein A2Y35_06880 [Spirochaetes bacterium GWE1_60_18]OHD60384.1 MAG: hypothetical protein A2Y32_00645 [Spirochaetes bacterium GWF1_60_12]
MRYSKGMKHYLLLLAGLVGGILAYAGVPGQPLIEITTTSLAQDGKASLVVSSAPTVATVQINRHHYGLLPVELKNLTPERYALIISAPGYHDCAVDLSLAADTRTELYVELVQKTGYLQVSVNVPNATVRVGQTEYPAGLIELSVGQHDISVRAFGYASRELEVLVPLNLINYLAVDLEAVEFSLTTPLLSRGSFNPRNAGLQGTTILSYEVTNRGLASYQVFDAAGELRYAETGTPFATWQQDWYWNGRDQAGTILPDGLYTIKVIVQPDADTLTNYQTFEYALEARLDSSLLVLPQGLSTVLPGPALAYGAFLPAADSLYWGIGLLARSDSSGLPQLYASLKGNLALRRLFDLGLVCEVGPDSGALILRGGLRAGLPAASLPLLGSFSPGAALSFDLPVAGDTEALRIRLGLPLSLGTPFLFLQLAPEFSFRYDDGPAWQLSAAAAIGLSGYNLAAQLSARLSSADLAGGFSLQWPMQLALDLNLLPPGLPLRASLNGQLGLGASQLSWQAGLYFEVEALR